MMPGVLLAFLLLLLSHLVPGKVLLLDTETKSEDSGEMHVGQDYDKFWVPYHHWPGSQEEEEEEEDFIQTIWGGNCHYERKWHKKNNKMKKKMDARGRKKGIKVAPKGFWIHYHIGTDRFCCKNRQYKGILAANPGECRQAIKLAE